ncbi:CPBP family intramembrane glutamic endopeptidase [Horticoccus sp. 23ND18S-11]|uniref:CPBP family intramembrane glutamic endopeptidase n=1 Tax=Horticoccus sp. 23ND18S-11 TaxID=3391832 RepID=UPI0039C98754
MSERVSTLAASFELGLALTGAVLLWRIVLRPAARETQPAPALAPWDIKITDFLMFILFVIGGTLLAAAIASVIGKQLQLRGDAVTIVNGAGSQLGMLAGVLLFHRRPGRPPEAAEPKAPGVFSSGAATFLISLPIVLVASLAWAFILKTFGLPTERQNLIAMFANADSIWLFAIMTSLAILIAPLTEELVFRAGFYRYLRTRIPHWAAVLTPALFFATLHVNWPTLEGLSSLVPLVVLAVMFSLAYQRTGRIGTAIVAHAIFNLNTIVLIVAGVGV